MIRGYTVEQVRAAESVVLDRVGGSVLMARAAWAIAGAVAARLPIPLVGSAALLLVGSGNNGGDALYAGGLLRRRGLVVDAVLTDPSHAHAEGLAEFRRRGGRVHLDPAAVDPALFEAADVIIDGLVGIGSVPPLRPVAAALVELANRSPALRVAIDVPSGVGPDDGTVPGPAFAAEVTISVGAAKSGLLIADQVGELVVVAIGMAPEIDVDPAVTGPPDAVSYDDEDVTDLIGRPGSSSDKYSGGVVGIVAGSERYPGAAVLCTGAAVSLRPGMVRYAGPQAAAVLARWPEVVAGPDPADAGRVQAWVVGPGMGTDAAAFARLRTVLDSAEAVLVDADGLTLLAAHPDLLARRVRHGRATLLTPHAGEFTRLFPDLDPADRLASARTAARRSGATVLLKGHRTVVAAPDGRTAVNRSGSGWLGSAGSGDVLSGVIGSLLATGAEPVTAAAAGAHRHGRAGEQAQQAGRAGAQALWEYLAAP